ncbi:hypothetical protein BDV95DRAFT_609696 [Massariosphaeria phaeospora]|uniref:Uncharacterized protein n=1 Tax=Massariosphaeria phaeospora TaxID=100035 RepID=A0A7C8I9W7_9PLEO|nr:hypothetical protein BDV95DRAFT_609696 [Massariosphaeria phaeospora]
MPPLSDIQVTSQELQVFRQRLQPYHADTTDDQLRQIIMDQKTNMARRQQLNNLQTATYPTTRLSPKPFSTGKEDTAILTDLVEEVMPTVEEVAAHRSYYTRHAKVESTLKSLELPPRYLSPAPTRQKDQTSKIRDRKQESSPASSANNTMTMNGQRPIKSNFLPGPSQLPRPITSQTTGTQLPPLALATPDIPSLPSFTEMEKLPPLLDSDSLDQKDHSDDQDAGAADHRTVNRSRNPRREPTQYSLYIPTQDYAHDPRYTVPEAAPVPPSGTDAVRTNHIQDTLVNKDPNGTPPGWWTLNQGEEVMSRSMTRKEWMLHQAPQMGPMGNNPQMSRQRGQIPTNTTLSTQTKPELVPNTHALSHLQPQHRLLSTPSIPPIREEVPPPLPPPHALGKASGMGQDPGGQWGNTTSPNDFGNGFNGSRRLASMKPESGYLSMEGRDHEFWGQQQSLQQPDALPPLKDYNPWQAQQSRLSREMTVQESYVTYHATPENTQFVDPRMSTTLERDRISRAESRRRMTERMPPPPGLTHEQWQQQEDEALQRQINRQIPRQQRRRLKQQQQQQVTQAQQRIEILPSYSSMEYSPRLPPPGI